MLKPLRAILLSLAIATVLERVHAQEPTAQSSDKKSIQVFVATKDSKPSTTFSADVPGIYAFWKGHSLEAGDKIKAIWIAEDIGNAAPKESKILEAEAKATKAEDGGAFSLSRPPGKIWPVGQYAVAIYINDSFTQRAKFKITEGVQIEVH
jgi:hypothetical protein